MERLSIFQRLRGFFMMDRDKGRQQPQNTAGRPGSDPQALYQNERPRTREGAETRLTDRFSRDLTRMAALGALDPLVGREQEVGRVIQILARRTKNNPALIGEPGVGKTAVAEGLALRMASGAVPEPLRGNLCGWWSRRIDGEHRIVYRQQDGCIVVAACRGHYE